MAKNTRLISLASWAAPAGATGTAPGAVPCATARLTYRLVFVVGGFDVCVVDVTRTRCPCLDLGPETLWSTSLTN